MSTPLENWLDSVNSQLDFHLRTSGRKRVDSDFDWEWLRSSSSFRHRFIQLATPVLNNLFPSVLRPYTRKWLNLNAERLWETREMLVDEVSTHFFDAYLQLICSGYQRFYFPRTEFVDLFLIQSENGFVSSLPKDYLGIPLKVFTLKVNAMEDIPELKLVTTKIQLEVLNRYRQYLPKRGDVDFSPSPGETVLDCGACIGEIALLFAALVGKGGAVHLFDPVPLHTRYCAFQAELNPELGGLMHINALAVGECSSKKVGSVADTTGISPGGCRVDSFEIVSLDDYVTNNRVSRVDYVKMDIEGAELAALKGAVGVIENFKPRLAISAYHKPEDLWEIPAQIKKMRPDYRLYFGHHSPMNWEAVFYAI